MENRGWAKEGTSSRRRGDSGQPEGGDTAGRTKGGATQRGCLRTAVTSGPGALLGRGVAWTGRGLRSRPPHIHSPSGRQTRGSPTRVHSGAGTLPPTFGPGHGVTADTALPLCRRRAPGGDPR